MSKAEELLPDELIKDYYSNKIRPSPAEIVEESVERLKQGQHVAVNLTAGLTSEVMALGVAVEFPGSATEGSKKTLVLLPEDSSVDSYLENAGWLEGKLKVEAIGRSSPKSSSSMSRLIDGSDVLVVTPQQITAALRRNVISFQQLGAFNLVIVDAYGEPKREQQFQADVRDLVASLGSRNAHLLDIGEVAGGRVRRKKPWEAIPDPHVIQTGKGKRPRGREPEEGAEAGSRQARTFPRPQIKINISSIKPLERLLWIVLIAVLILFDLELYSSAQILERAEFVLRVFLIVALGLILVVVLLRILGALLAGNLNDLRKLRGDRTPSEFSYDGDIPIPTRRRTGSRSRTRRVRRPPVSVVHGLGVQDWPLPKVDEMLEPGNRRKMNGDHIREQVEIIEHTLESFGAPATVVDVAQGPTATQYGVEPGTVKGPEGRRAKVKMDELANLADDLALALAAKSIRIQAPVPGTGYVGIEVPNPDRVVVSLRDVIGSDEFQALESPLRLGLGQDVAGRPVVADLAQMPHLLIAGGAGSGKSVCLSSIVACLLLHNSPESLMLVVVDRMRTEFDGIDDIPDFVAPIVANPGQAVEVRQEATAEMDDRYKRLAEAGARHVVEYNEEAAGRGQETMPYIVIVIGELVDLMLFSPEEVERDIVHLAQMSRATSIHMVIATGRPTVDVITGLIKANIPARIAFTMASGEDSRVILDTAGAERLLGQGDMLFLSPDAAEPVRLQGSFVSEAELRKIADYWRSAQLHALAVPAREGEELLQEAIELVRRLDTASTSMLQRRLRIGHTRASRLMEIMEQDGIIGPAEGTGNVHRALSLDDDSFTPEETMFVDAHALSPDQQSLWEEIDGNDETKGSDEPPPVAAPVAGGSDATQQITPLAKYQTTYVRGHDDYDESFSIENAHGDFLGEVGVGATEILGGETPKNVAAFEVWLFDKSDIQKVTKVVLSDYAFSSEAIRANLALKGEPILAQPGETIVLKTATLIVNALITEMEYGSGGSAPNSYFERFTIELRAWAKESDIG